MTLLLVIFLNFGLQVLAISQYDYCLIGAGPSGLQMGYFLQSKNRNYIIFEKGSAPGTFFQQYPRHEKLISINKIHTGKRNQEFNFRHDWNSLITDDLSFRISNYSKDFFPPKDALLRYLADFQKKYSINVKFNTFIQNVDKQAHDRFILTDHHGQLYQCKVLILATGIAVPNIPTDVIGLEHAEGYENVSIDPKDFEGQTVLILGRGNSAFEVADNIYGHTNLIHMVARSRVRLAWSTHYVGDLRALNNALLDNYQLKSLDAVLEANINQVKFIKEKQDDGTFKIRLDVPFDIPVDNFAMREPYDRVIRCLGFNFDMSIFNESAYPGYSSERGGKKFPRINSNYEASQVPNMFVIGTASHSLDFRKSAGGFIHGFRYTTQALHRMLEWKYEKIPWPHIELSFSALLNTILKRINEASGIYQMFQNLCDVYILNNESKTFKLLHEIPLNELSNLPQISGHNLSDTDTLIVMDFEYGANFSGPGKDVFNLNRATGDQEEAHLSNFLHPVFYFYQSLPTEYDMMSKPKWMMLPRPKILHHIVEDFLTTFNGRISHIMPLRRFLSNATQIDLRTHFAEYCMVLGFISTTVPLSCESYFKSGFGLHAEKTMLDYAYQKNLISLPS